MNEITAATGSAGLNPEMLYEWGLSVIRLFQSAGNPVLTFVARFFTFFGYEIFYMLVVPFVFWCVDEFRGFTLGLALFVSNGINTAIKGSLRVPRPFYRDPSVKMIEETGFSTPSAHAQNSATFWPILVGAKKTKQTSVADAVSAKNPRGSGRIILKLLIAIGGPLCIGLSRVYLGVHYPTDVFFGWAIGAVIAICTIFLFPAIAGRVKHSSAFQTFSASINSYCESSGKSFRTGKIARAACIAFILNAIGHGDSSMGGVVFGFMTGYIMLTDTGHSPKVDETAAKTDARSLPVHFSAKEGSILKKIFRFLLGFVILAILYLGLKEILPKQGSDYYELCRFLRYGIVGFWITYGAPRLFTKIELAQSDQ